MKIALLCSALALAITAGGTAAQDAPAPRPSPSPQQKQELDAARGALDKAAKHYADLAARYGGTDRMLRIERSALRKPVIGVVLAADEQAGVRIVGVTPGSAAAAAGLKSGDRLASIDGKRIDAAIAEARVAQARELLAARGAKTTVTLGYERDGKPATVSVTPKLGERVLVAPRGMWFDGDNKIFLGGDGELADIEAARTGGELAAHARIAAEKALAATGGARRTGELAFAIAPDVRRDIIRLGSDCKGEDCKLPALAEALRWNGLNLAAIDAQLGRYFGADTGVLVLSASKDLDALQGGDVILKIAGKPVANPREAMALLRAQPADGKVAVDYLRDRKPAAARMAVPKAKSFPEISFRMAAPAEGEGANVRRIMMIDKDGKTQTWEGGKDDAPPAWVQALPADGQRTEKRVQIFRRDGDDTPATAAPPAGDID